MMKYVYKSLTFLLLVWQFSITYGLDCYNCTKIRNISDCHNVVQCNKDEHCYSARSGYGDQVHFDLGCRSPQICLSTSTATLPHDLVGRDVGQNADCNECCSIDACNKRLCNANEKSVLNDGWSLWSVWTCTSLQQGQQETRTRTCANPSSSYGYACAGTDWQSRPCQINVRIVGDTSDYGRADVFINGQWGTICSDHFNKGAAKVICRMLGLENKLAGIHATPKNATDKVWLDGAVCSGFENTLLDCGHGTIGSHNCTYAAGIYCG